MAADLFESYEVTLVAVADPGRGRVRGLAEGRDRRRDVPAVRPRDRRHHLDHRDPRRVAPLRDRARDEGDQPRVLHLGGRSRPSAVFVLAAAYMEDSERSGAVLIGLVLASVIQVLTEHFTVTKRKPVQEIAEATLTGRPPRSCRGSRRARVDRVVDPGRSARRPSSAAFYLGDTTAERLYFIRSAGMGMLTTVGVDRLDGHLRPGLGQRPGHRRDVRRVRGRGRRDPRRPGRDRELDEGDHEGDGDRDGGPGRDVAVRVVRGGAARRRGLRLPGHPDRPSRRAGRPARSADRSPFLFSSLAIRAVGRAASQVVVEVRNQFREHPGSWTTPRSRTTARVVDICTRTSLRELMTRACWRSCADHRRVLPEGRGAGRRSWPGRSSPGSCWP